MPAHLFDLLEALLVAAAVYFGVRYASDQHARVQLRRIEHDRESDEQWHAREEARRERDRKEKLAEKADARGGTLDEVLDEKARRRRADEQAIERWFEESPDASMFDENQRDHARWAYMVLCGHEPSSYSDKANAREMLDRWGAPRPD